MIHHRDLPSLIITLRFPLIPCAFSFACLRFASHSGNSARTVQYYFRSDFLPSNFDPQAADQMMHACTLRLLGEELSVPLLFQRVQRTHCGATIMAVEGKPTLSVDGHLADCIAASELCSVEMNCAGMKYTRLTVSWLN